LRVAVGRRPRTEDIGLDKTKIRSDRGFIQVNEWLQTAEPNVYAIGDIVMGTPQLAHVGSMQGMVAVAKIAGRATKPLNKNRIPGCTYSHPEIGSVGLTEAKAKEAGLQVKVGKFPFTANSRASIVVWFATPIRRRCRSGSKPGDTARVNRCISASLDTWPSMYPHTIRASSMLRTTR
jgi:pyruvate/2-oxoglutarate dehydrogenase complex dihydrolipoamide dehydrogenase (E3) component